ncbi:disintegrin and metalloproteinase domain-containing protein 9-like [Clarias gariepinus]|uniref:disintegrin and metalloproteinase domain-containing protein 9-like n=1 Tax=Clarias gariepinus TaxID=13013 RepID=UPI00234C13ED|nr:disintegrin and metalloproteinase domain-containing protein 9-like [Clarias gariepinus]
MGHLATVLLLVLIHADGAVSQDLFPEQTSHLRHYQIVIPQLVHKRWERHDDSMRTHTASSDPDSLTYSIEINDTVHLLHLIKNRDFLSPDFTVVSHDVHQVSVKTHRVKPVLCHYHGRVSGYEESLVALSTCTGLRGVIFLGRESYALEPARNASNNEHILFPLKDNPSEPFVCGVDSGCDQGDCGHTLSMDTLLRRKRSLPQTRYVELVLVVDNQRYNLKNRNRTAVTEEMIQLANYLDTYYKELNIRIALVGIEIFKTGNPFDVNGDPRDVLAQFAAWRKDNLTSQIRSDMSQLVVGRSGAYSGGILGMAYVGTVCSASAGGGISVYSNNALQYYSTVLAHEMGHNLGMTHDDGRCQCDGHNCIMYSQATGSTSFSTCSDQDFQNLVQRGGGLCLLNVPTNIITKAQCGNGVLEEGEECDCGTPQTCTNKCCNAATCTLTKGSACATGLCCQDCQFMVSGAVCRSSVNECDLPEFCNGSSPFCPGDFYLMDGLTCSAGAAYCYEGRCQTLDYECQQLFGKSAIKANDQCFPYVNTKGTTFGNCGYSGTTPIPCTVANSMCGKIQCTNYDSNYPPPGAAISIQEISPGVKCMNADFNLGSDVLDPGYVKTGTVCATGKVCMKLQCVNASVLTSGQTCNAATDCNSNGVCNDLGHCHCNDGWAPPSCNTRGRGGSVDSGPAQIDYSLRNGLLIFFLLVLPLLVLLIFVLLYIFRRDSLKRCLRCSKRRRTNETKAQSNVQPSRNVQRQAQPPPLTRVPSTTPQYLPSTSAETSNTYSNLQPAVWTSQLPRNGPGAPRPIPPRNVIS